MDRLWTPWRYAYIGGPKPDGCVFCQMPSHSDSDALIVYRAQLCFVVLNRYPYNNGHLMVVPYRHAARLDALTPAERAELIELAALAESCLQDVYRPDGINAGLNLGSAAGAGIAAHLHFHILPRWTGDANFLSTIGETRILPEELPQTQRRLAAAFAATSLPSPSNSDPRPVHSPPSPTHRSDAPDPVDR